MIGAGAELQRLQSRRPDGRQHLAARRRQVSQLDVTRRQLVQYQRPGLDGALRGFAQVTSSSSLSWCDVIICRLRIVLPACVLTVKFKLDDLLAKLP